MKTFKKFIFNIRIPLICVDIGDRAVYVEFFIVDLRMLGGYYVLEM